MQSVQYFMKELLLEGVLKSFKIIFCLYLSKAQSKESEEPSTEAEATKDATPTDATSASNENTINGLTSIPPSSLKTGVNVPVQGGVKRGADSVAKQPPLKKKKQ